MTDAETFDTHDPVYMSERDLARRWDKSTRSLQRWRAIGYGPAHIRLRGGIRYLFADVLAFEAKLRRGGGEGDAVDERDTDGHSDPGTVGAADDNGGFDGRGEGDVQ